MPGPCSTHSPPATPTTPTAQTAPSSVRAIVSWLEKSGGREKAGINSSSAPGLGRGRIALTKGVFASPPSPSPALAPVSTPPASRAPSAVTPPLSSSKTLAVSKSSTNASEPPATTSTPALHSRTVTSRSGTAASAASLSGDTPISCPSTPSNTCFDQPLVGRYLGSDEEQHEDKTANKIEGKKQKRSKAYGELGQPQVDGDIASGKENTLKSCNASRHDDTGAHHLQEHKANKFWAPIRQYLFITDEELYDEEWVGTK